MAFSPQDIADLKARVQYAQHNGFAIAKAADYVQILGGGDPPAGVEANSTAHLKALLDGISDAGEKTAPARTPVKKPKLDNQKIEADRRATAKAEADRIAALKAEAEAEELAKAAAEAEATAVKAAAAAKAAEELAASEAAELAASLAAELAAQKAEDEAAAKADAEAPKP